MKNASRSSFPERRNDNTKLPTKYYWPRPDLHYFVINLIVALGKRWHREETRTGGRDGGHEAQTGQVGKRQDRRPVCRNIDLCKPFSFTSRVSDRLYPPGFRDGSAKAQTAILPAVVLKTNEADISQKGTLPIDYAPPWGAYQEIRSPRCFITCATTRSPGSHALAGSSKPRAVPFRPVHRRRGQVVSVHSAASPMSMWASTCAFFDKTFSRIGRMYTLGCFQCTFCRSTFVHIAIYLRFCPSNIVWGRQNVH